MAEKKINVDGLSSDNLELIDSLRDLDYNDEEIAKSLNLDLIEDKEDEKGSGDISKSIDEEIAKLQAKKAELQKSEKTNPLSSEDLDHKFEEIQKSITDNIQESVSEQTKGTQELIKSLTDQLVDLKGANEKIHDRNEDLNKSQEEIQKNMNEIIEIVKGIASFTPGFKSMRTNPNYVGRFPGNEEPKDTGKGISKSMHRDKISHELSKAMDDETFRKRYADDVSKYESAGYMSEDLEKAMKDELKLELVD